MIANMLDNKKNNPVVNELFIRGRKLIRQFSFFITQPYFAVPKIFRINSAQNFIMKIPTKRELQQITSNQSGILEKATFSWEYSPLGKEFEKQIKQLKTKE